MLSWTSGGATDGRHRCCEPSPEMLPPASGGATKLCRSAADGHRRCYHWPAAFLWKAGIIAMKPSLPIPFQFLQFQNLILRPSYRRPSLPIPFQFLQFQKLILRPSYRRRRDVTPLPSRAPPLGILTLTARNSFDLPNLAASVPNSVVRAEDKARSRFPCCGDWVRCMQTCSSEPEVGKRVELLTEIQSQHDDLEGKIFERDTLEAKYQKMYEPLYSKCYDVVNGVVEVEGVTKEGSDETAEDQIEEKGMSGFWLNAMKNHDILAEAERDKEAFKYLKDIKWFRITEPKGFKLEFHFDTNPFFKNTVLTKTYHTIDDDEPILEKAIGTEIEWYPGKCLTQKVIKKKPKKGSKNAKPILKTEACMSFFNFFSPPDVPDDDEDILQNQLDQDYDAGYRSTIIDKNTPHAVSRFTGEAAQDEDFELEDGEDKDDEDDDDSASSRPIPVSQIQRLLPLPLVLQEFFNQRGILGGGRGHSHVVGHLLPPCPAACPGVGSMYLAPSLPDDALADILRRLAPHGLAASRCVCKSWHRVVDSYRLLRADLLPLSLGGIFLEFHHISCTQFLCRPTTGAAVSGQLYYTLAARFPDYKLLPVPVVLDHCNGLLLLGHCMVNPATRQWTPLPPAPDLPQPLPGMHPSTCWYLVFDPILSPNYFDVLIMPKVPSELDECGVFEWPPFTLILPVFSSKTCSWEERTFRREGEAAGMVPGMGRSDPYCNDYQCAYWRGALYICSYFFVLRISLSDNTYRVIRFPTERLPNDRQGCYDVFIGKSINGIYCASTLESFVRPSIQLQVWLLNDLNEWVLKHDRDIFPSLPNLNYDKPCDGPWTLQEFDYKRGEENVSVLEDNKEAVVEKEKFEWDSDNDNVLEFGSRSEIKHVDFLGFHPYKEVVLLSLWDRVLAYHWSSSKVQDLGKLFPKFYFDDDRDFMNKLVTRSFPYTPCWLGELPGKQFFEAMTED